MALGSTSELLEMVEETKTLDGVSVYENGLGILVRLSPSQLSPTALYVLKGKVNKVGSIRKKLLDENRVDILNLTGVFDNDEIVIGPPVVEFWDGELLIVDGHHRLIYALWEGISSVTVLLITNPPDSCPFISDPVEWKDVIEYEEKPSDPSLLRRLRSDIGDHRCLYRDLRFLGSSGRRPQGNESY